MTRKRMVGPGGGDFAPSISTAGGKMGGGKSIITGKKSTLSKKPKGSVGDDPIFKREKAALDAKWNPSKKPWQINKELMRAKKGESVPHVKEMKAYYKANNKLLAESYRRMNPKPGGYRVDKNK